MRYKYLVLERDMTEREGYVEKILNDLADQGWRLISHSANLSKITFILENDGLGNDGKNRQR